jgi:hypothetical protein
MATDQAKVAVLGSNVRRVDSPVEQEKPVEQNISVEKETEQVVQDQPKVRRVIDEEGGTTTATVSSTSLSPGLD